MPTRTSEYPQIEKPRAMTTLIVKITDGTDIRRFTANVADLTFESVQKRTAEAFGLGVKDLKLQYKDDEGDMVTMSSNDEMLEAIGLATSMVPAVLRLNVSKTTNNPKTTNTTTNTGGGAPPHDMNDLMQKISGRLPPGRHVRQDRHASHRRQPVAPQGPRLRPVRGRVPEARGGGEAEVRADPAAVRAAARRRLRHGRLRRDGRHGWRAPHPRRPRRRRRGRHPPGRLVRQVGHEPVRRLPLPPARPQLRPVRRRVPEAPAEGAGLLREDRAAAEAEALRRRRRRRLWRPCRVGHARRRLGRPLRRRPRDAPRRRRRAEAGGALRARRLNL